MQNDELNIGIDLFKENDKSKLDGQSFKKIELPSILDRIISFFNKSFRDKANQYEKDVENKLLEKNVLEEQSIDILSKVNYYIDKKQKIQNDIKHLEKIESKEKHKLEDEREKADDTFRFPKWIFIIFGIVAGAGEVLNYFHMFQTQEYIINELSGKTNIGRLTTDGILYYILPAILAAALVISIVFLSKYVGKILRQLRTSDTRNCYKLRSEDEELITKLFEDRKNLDSNSEDYMSRKKDLENQINELEKRRTGSLSFKGFFCLLFSREVFLFVIGGTAFVFIISYGATFLRESALKQQYNATQLSISANKNIDKLISSKGSPSNGIASSRIGGTVNSRFSSNTNKFSSPKSTSTAVNISKDALKSDKLKQIETIYNSRAEGSKWFFFINAILYVVGILLGYFSHTSNRNIEACENELKRISNDLVKQVKMLDKVIKESTSYNKSVQVVSFRNSYFKLLKDIDDSMHDIKLSANNYFDDIKLNYDKFVQLQLLNDTSTDVDNEYATQLFDEKINTLKASSKEGIFKYLEIEERNLSNENTWDELLNKYRENKKRV